MEINDYIVSNKYSLKEVWDKINKNEDQLVFITNKENKILFAVSDGDIRRYLLGGGNIEDNVLNLNKNSVIVATTINEANKLCKQYKIVPVVNNKGILKILVKKGKISCIQKLNNVPVVIQAGGLGTRLYPYTKILPKPLIPIGDIPIIEKIINRFVDFGCKDFYIIVNHKKEMIKAYFAEIAINYNITFVDEMKPLGTGGGLSLLKNIIKNDFIFANCDTFLDCDFFDVFETHKHNNNDVTMICSNIKVQIPYGTISCDNEKKLVSFNEKPTFYFLSNVGVYIVNRNVVNTISNDTKIHFTTVCEQLISTKKVGIYEISEEEWHDMGEIDKLNKMIEE